MSTQGLASRCPAVLTFLGLAVFLCSTVEALSQGAARPSATSSPAERLFIAEFSLDYALDQLYQSEEKRLLELCKYYGSACFSRHFSPMRRMVAALHSLDSSGSPVIGRVHAVLKVSGEEYGGLAIGLDIEWIAKPGQFESWMGNVGDWGYGIHVEGVRRRAEWVQMSGPPFPTPVWVSTETASFTASVLPLTGHILTLERLNAQSPNGTIGPITKGNYLILSVKGSDIEFRKEVASDSCGDPVPAPPVMPPTLRAAAEEFFAPDHSPRFSLAYPRGC